MTQHGRVAEERLSWRNPTKEDGTRTFRMAFPAKGGLRSCPVEGYLGQAVTRAAIRVQFLHRHVLDTMVILDEGNRTHPWCT